MTTNYAKRVIYNIFDEGDRDLIFIGQLIGHAEYDENDLPRGRDREEILQAAASLAYFLKRDDVFALFEMSRDAAGDLSETLLEAGQEDFLQILRAADKFDPMNVGFSFILKKQKPGKGPLSIPNEILKIIE